MNTFNNLYDRVNYSIGLPYISNIITEYDLQKANISALKYYNIIDDNQYNKYLKIPKQTREVEIGLMIKKNPEIYNYIKNGIHKAKELFFKINNIKDNEVVSIKNDAIFLTGSRSIQCNINNSFIFIPKNTYTFYMKTIYNMEIYYSYNQISNSESIDVKGIKNSKLEYHRNYMINFICTILYMIQTCTIEDTLKYYNNFYNDFITLKLPVEYYREFNSISKFKINDYLVDNIQEDAKKYLNINNNITLLRDIFSILSDIYFSKSNKR